MSNVPNVDNQLIGCNEFLLIGDFSGRLEELSIVTLALNSWGVNYRTKNDYSFTEPVLVVPGLGSFEGVAAIYSCGKLLSEWQHKYRLEWDCRPMVVA